MKNVCGLVLLLAFAACSSSEKSFPAPVTGEPPGQGPANSTVLDLDDVKANTSDYEWFDFRPNVKKLILSGAAETEHVAILWYTTEDGGVGLHYHAKTESVFVIEGTQTDGKGSYPTGTVYFNPPGSGHQITDSSGFFLLAYSAPPDFTMTDRIGEYTPICIDTAAEDLTSANPFEEKKSGVRAFTVPIEAGGGLKGEFIESQATQAYTYKGNYLLVLKGSCQIDGATFGERKLVVAKAVEPQTYEVAATKDATCLALGVSF